MQPRGHVASTLSSKHIHGKQYCWRLSRECALINRQGLCTSYVAFTQEIDKALENGLLFQINTSQAILCCAVLSCSVVSDSLRPHQL